MQWGQTGRYRPDSEAARRRSAAGTLSSRRSSTRGPPSGWCGAPPPPGPGPAGPSDMPHGLTRLSILIPAVACRREVPKDCREVQRRRAVARLGRARDGPLRVPRLWARLPLRHDDEQHRRVAGQADRDRTDHAVIAGGQAADDDGQGLIRVGFTDGCGRCDQLIDDDALAPLELPGGPAGAQLPAAWVRSSCSISSRFFSISAMAPCDSMSRLDR